MSDPRFDVSPLDDLVFCVHCRLPLRYSRTVRAWVKASDELAECSARQHRGHHEPNSNPGRLRRAVAAGRLRRTA